MNYGMITLYSMWALELLVSAYRNGQGAIYAERFRLRAIRLTTLVVVLAWSHGWHLTWTP